MGITKAIRKCDEIHDLLNHLSNARFCMGLTPWVCCDSYKLDPKLMREATRTDIETRLRQIVQEQYDDILTQINLAYEELGELISGTNVDR